jgi:hypothetical protein
MNPADSERVQKLCSLIAVEQDRQKFLELVEELNSILSASDRRLQDKSPSGPEKAPKKE